MKQPADDRTPQLGTLLILAAFTLLLLAVKFADQVDQFCEQILRHH